MVELVDTQDLESCEETRAGSIPVIRTNITSTPFSGQSRVQERGFIYAFIFMSYLYPLSIY